MPRGASRPIGAGWNSAGVHLAQVRRDSQRELRLREDVALQIDARRDLDDRNAFALQAKHATFRDIDDLLPLRDRARTGK